MQNNKKTGGYRKAEEICSSYKLQLSMEMTI